MRGDEDRAGRALEGLTRACPYLFLVLSLVGTLFLAWNLPPFQGADELAHANRALIGSTGHLVGERATRRGGQIAGGVIEWSVYNATHPFNDIRFHTWAKADVADYVVAGQARWGGRTFFADFRGSAMYPPFFYVPATAGFMIAKAADLPVVQSLYLARMSQAVACCLIGFLALLLAGRSRLLLYGVLLLPMSLGLYSALTNDGMMIAVTALGCALICRPLSQGRPMQGRELAAAAICFALVGMTKAPYALFGLVLLAVDSVVPARRWKAAALVIAASAAWNLFTAIAVQVPLVNLAYATDPGAQIRYLFGDPLRIPGLAVRTLTSNWRAYSEAFIGVLGWLDTFLPKPYYPAAWTMLIMAAAAAASWKRPPQWRALPWAAALIWMGVFGAIHAALYVTWNRVGSAIVEGVAGRYFLPLACFLALGLEGARPLVPDTVWGRRLRLGLTAAVLAFPLVTLMIVQRTVIVRYYLD